MNYKEAMQYMEEAESRGSIPGLNNIRNLLCELGNPQDSLKFVHIAGTNGKGSTLAFMSSILSAAGYRTGCYISPVITSYEERFQIDNVPINKNDLLVYIRVIRKAVENMVKKGMEKPTVFELETAIAFLYFQAEKCDIVVLETGMGGTLDATNIIQSPLLAVITPVSMDHMGMLGNTLEEIAAQKAGIIKSGTMAVISTQSRAVRNIIKIKCDEMKVPLSEADNTQLKDIEYLLSETSFTYKELKSLKIRMSGTYQPENAATAIEGAYVLRAIGMNISDYAIREGLLEAKWQGRFQIIGRKPIFVIDGAHNEAGARALADSIKFYFTNKRIIYIMGVLKDKEYDKIVKETYTYASKIITITPRNNRGLDGNILKEEVMKYGVPCVYADSAKEAVEIAEKEAEEDDVIISFGSLSYMGEILSYKERV